MAGLSIGRCRPTDRWLANPPSTADRSLARQPAVNCRSIAGSPTRRQLPIDRWLANQSLIGLLAVDLPIGHQPLAVAGPLAGRRWRESQDSGPG
jgi:hypothetical protein